MVSKAWAKRIAEAQEQTTDTICGVEYLRIKYGDDYPDGKTRCRDCGVLHGQLHVVGCCVERCALCETGQAAFGCDRCDEADTVH